MYQLAASRSTTGWACVAVLLACCLVAHLVSASQFELDGNAITETSLDWQTVNFDTHHASFVTDNAGTTIFSSSKDVEAISNWKWTTGTVPDKDEITHAFATMRINGLGHPTLVFGADRFSNDGAAMLGFWFFQNSGVKPSTQQSGGSFKFDGSHTAGDLLVLVNFINGGEVAEVRAYAWDIAASNNLRPVLSNEITCGSVANPSACAITNLVAAVAPWPYTPKANIGSPGSFPPKTFIEGEIDLTVVYPNALPCFASFLAETRSSQELTATLKDFVFGEFFTCGLQVDLLCTSGSIVDGDHFVYLYTVAIKNTGLGAISNVSVVGPNGQEIAIVSQIQPEETVLVGESVSSYTNSLLLSAACASSTIRPGTVLFDCSAAAQCPFVPANPSLQLTKSCETLLSDIDIDGQSLKQVVVHYSGTVTNTGDVLLSSVSVWEDPNTPTNAADDSLFSFVNLGLGQVVNFSGEYVPTQPTAASFSDTVNATATPALGFPSFATNNNIQATCQAPDIQPSMFLHKHCNVQLVLQDNKLVVQVCFTLNATNTGNVDLVDLVLTDDSGTTGDSSDDLYESLQVLGVQQSYIVEDCYEPQSLPLDSDITFADEADAVADPIVVGFPAVSQSASASCSLCV